MKGESDSWKEEGRWIFMTEVGLAPAIRLETSQKNTKQDKKTSSGEKKRYTQIGGSGWEKEGSDGNKGRLCSHDITSLVLEGTQVVSYKVRSS